MQKKDLNKEMQYISNAYKKQHFILKSFSLEAHFLSKSKKKKSLTTQGIPF